LWKCALSRNVEESFRNILDPYPEADDFLYLITSSLFKDIAYLSAKYKSQKRRHRTKARFGLRKHKNYAAFSNKLVFEK